VPAPARSRILIVSDEFDPHADRMLTLLRGEGVECVRWIPGAFPLQSRIALEYGAQGCAGSLATASRQVELESIRSVWYRHPAAPGLPAGLAENERRFADAESRSVLSGMYQTFDWFWVNHPDRVRVANSKPLQLRLASELGLRIPKTLITNDPGEVRRFHAANGGNVVYKPLNSGFLLSTERLCYTTPLSARELERIDLIKAGPGIFQENIAKKVELRITAIGRRLFATEIDSQASAAARNDWREAEIEDLPHRPHDLPATVERKCLDLLQRLGLVYGAIDMIVTPDGEYVFLENNPSGQFGWIEGRTSAPLTATLAKMLIAGRPV
jgi:glutathione synthase/RimK-type ligase-like ATP-grasp enzyme